MSQKFQAAVHHRDDVTFVKLTGVIDEDNELTELTDKIPSGTVVIDLGEVERINSCGVRDWVNWLSKVESKNAEVVLVECSPAIVAQINLVNNFTGQGTVKSFYVPYFCPECDEEKVLLCEAGDMGPPPHEPPTCRCDECDLVMDFDDMPDSYFAFLSNQKKIAKPEKINAVLTEFSQSDGEKSRIRSRVSSSNIAPSQLATSLPSVPSLPAIAARSASPSATTSKPAIPPPATEPRPGPEAMASVLAGMPAARPAAAVSQRSGMIVYVLVAILLGAIGVLAFLLFGAR
jgi:anti-anti-sigma factor